MKISANAIRAGNVLVHNNKLYVVTKMPEHTKPGKGGAYVQVEMKDIKTGTKVNERFSSSVTVERAQFEQKNYQYLYPEGENLVFMDIENFEQILISKTLLDDRLPFLQESMNVQIESYEDEPLNITLPATVDLVIVETEPTIKGATATSTYKPATLENGVRVMVPPYIETGQKIVVKIEDSTFVERAK